MQKTVFSFIFCVLLSEVSPKVPIRKEDLLNKKAALSKQLSPSVPKWDEIALKLHTKDKQPQNKAKTLTNFLKVVTAKEIDIPESDIEVNKTVTISSPNINATNTENVKINDTSQNSTYHKDSAQKSPFKNSKIQKSKPNNSQSNTTVAHPPKKYAANETIGARLALFLQQNAVNYTKEKPSPPEIIAPTMIPIFKPMPSSTRNTIPQPLANELIRKDNFIPQELNPEQLKNLDDIELNPNVFNPVQNKAVLTPLLVTEAEPKEVLSHPKNIPNSQNSVSDLNNRPIDFKEESLNTNNFSQNVPSSVVRTDVLPPTNKHPSDITLKYVDSRNSNHPNSIPNDSQKQFVKNTFDPMQNIPANTQEAQKLDTAPAQMLNFNGYGAVMNQLNPGNNEQSLYMPINNGPQYELKISPPLPNNGNENSYLQPIPNDNSIFGLNPQFIKASNDFEKIQFNSYNHGTAINQNNIAVNLNSKDKENQHGFAGNHNDYIQNQNHLAPNLKNVDTTKNPMREVNQHSFMVNQHSSMVKQQNYMFNQPNSLVNQQNAMVNQYNLPVNQNDISGTNGMNQIPVNTGVITNPQFLNQRASEHAKVNPMPTSSGFQLPCLKASDVLEDFGSVSNCCQQNKPILNSITENPVTNLQCEKPILVDSENIEDESVAIVFKPKNISLLKFYGDLLKKITLTVLVPYHISKLTSS